MMTFNEFANILTEAFPQTNTSQLEKFRALEALYGDWNSKINVISRKDIEQLYPHHILHSLAIAKYLLQSHPAEFQTLQTGRTDILDLGTGGGLPGIPLAILFPQAQFTLCDSVGKKITVASGITNALKLNNITFVNDRAENIHSRFDYIVSRAVTSLDNFYPWTKGKYTKRILYLKGGDINEEISSTMQKYRLPAGSVSTWNISSWLKDEYYSAKFVIDIK